MRFSELFLCTGLDTLFFTVLLTIHSVASGFTDKLVLQNVLLLLQSEVSQQISRATVRRATKIDRAGLKLAAAPLDDMQWSLFCPMQAA